MASSLISAILTFALNVLNDLGRSAIRIDDALCVPAVTTVP